MPDGWEATDAQPRWFVRDPGGIHGLAHAARVRAHAMAVADALDLDDRIRRVLDRAAAWHDIGRTHDGADPDHGRASVARVCELELDHAEPAALRRLERFVIRYHSVDDRLGLEAAAADPEPAIAELALQVFKDADGLDRVRIHDLDVRRLRFDVSREREQEAWRLLGVPDSFDRDSRGLRP